MTGPGDRLGGRYRLEEQIGDGGTATVFRALDEHLGVHCALKILKLEAGREVQLRARLRDEVDAMSRVAHPNILRIYGNGQDDGVDWIAMELSEDGSLADRVRSEGPLSARRAIQVVLQVLAALEASHAAGVVHRDVKPDNVLLHADGTVRLCDFGIALLDDHTRVTRSGFAMGSIPYMAPEQRIDAHAVGPTADLYAVAATLYHLLTNATPVDLFLASPTSPRFTGLPEGLVELIRKGTHADPAQRFDSAASMIIAVERCLALSSELPLVATIDEGYTAVGLSQTSRVPTAVPPESRSMEAMEIALQREWIQREARARRKRNGWISRSVLAGAFTLVGVGVAIFGTVSLDDWIATEEAQREAVRVPIEGTWKGVLGAHQATLVLVGVNHQLTGELTLELGPHVLRSSVVGAVQDGFLVLVDEGEEVRRGTYRATIAKGVRLDGDYDGGDEVEPLHLVRVH